MGEPLLGWDVAARRWHAVLVDRQASALDGLLVVDDITSEVCLLCILLAWIAGQLIRRDAYLNVVPRGCGTASPRLPPQKRGQVGRMGVAVLKR